MTAWLPLSLFVSFAIGWLTVSLLWPAGVRASAAQPALRIFLGFGLGQGMTSCIAFLFLLVNGRISVLYYLCELGVLACLIIIFCLRTRKIKASRSALKLGGPDGSETGNAALLAIAFYATAATALMTIALRLSRWPHGGYDAWTNWNLRARAIFRGGNDWHDFSSHLLHPDYPLLLPLSVVRTWMYGGSETAAAPIILAWLFAAAILGLVTSAVAALCGRSQGYVAGVVLLGYPVFVLHGSSQMAEAPLTFFYIAALVLIAFHNDAAEDEGSGALMLAGLMAGLAAWTKNEGLMFLAVLGVAHFAVVVRARGLRAYRKQALSLATGILPVVAVLIYFKTQFASPNVWVSKMSAPQVLTELTDAGRYVVIAKEFARRFLFYSGYGINMAYLLLMFVFCFGGTRRHMVSVAQAALVLALMMAGFVWVYLTVYSDVGAFMRFSLDRVLYQLWPVLVVTFFLLAAPAELYFPGRERRRAPGTQPA